MSGRNKITLILVGLILLGSVLATIITIRDYNQIINDFNNFTIITNPPIDGEDNNIGNLLLYIVANTTTNTIGISTKNTQEDIQHIYLTITEINLKEKATGKYERILSEKQIDLKNFEEISLYDNLTVKTGNYSYIKIRFSSPITVITNTNTYNFNLQGNQEVQVPFYKDYSHGGNHIQGDLSLKGKDNTPLLLQFNVLLTWMSRRAIVYVGAFLTF